MIELNKEAKRTEIEILRSSPGTYTWTSYDWHVTKEQMEAMAKLIEEHEQLYKAHKTKVYGV